MKTKAVRLYGKQDLRLEEFELPEFGEGEILAKIVCDCICMSTHKTALQGETHKRVPNDVRDHPVIIGHEFCGEILDIGERWKGQYRIGDKFAIQPTLSALNTMRTAGYSFQTVGGDATYVVIPEEFMACGCILPYKGDAYFHAALSEPLSCVAGACKAMYHTQSGAYAHHMGIAEGGRMAILAGAGPMGLSCVDYILHTNCRPGLLVVTDVDRNRLDRAAEILTVEEAAYVGVKLSYVDASALEDPVATLLSMTDGNGYDDVMVFAPVPALVEQADAILARDGCLNFFAGPTKSDFSARINFYNVHYTSTHVVGTSGSNIEDMKECLAMISEGRLHPAALVTHVGGIDAVIDATLNLPQISGGKKLIYTHVNMPLTAIGDFEALGKTDPFYQALCELTQETNGLWNKQAEAYLLSAQGGT